MYSFALYAIFTVVATLFLTRNIFAETPRTFVRTGTDMRCPPHSVAGGGVDPATRPEDANVSGRVGLGPSNDWLLSRDHWDDGHGVDFTVEQWCLASPQVYTMRIIQSQNGEQFIRATPNGSGRTLPIGTC